MWSCRLQSGFNGVTDRSFGTASDLCFIISTRHWYSTPCGSGCWPAPNPHDAPRWRKRRCVWVPTAASVHKGVKLFALKIPLLVRAMSSTTSLLHTDESFMRWSSYICHCEGLAFWQKDSLYLLRINMKKSLCGDVPIHNPAVHCLWCLSDLHAEMSLWSVLTLGWLYVFALAPTEWQPDYTCNLCVGGQQSFGCVSMSSSCPATLWGNLSPVENVTLEKVLKDMSEEDSFEGQAMIFAWGVVIFLKCKNGRTALHIYSKAMGFWVIHI